MIKPASRPVILVFFLLILSVSAVFAAAAQNVSFDPERDVEVELIAGASGVSAGGSLPLAVIFHVPPDYHITSLESGLNYVQFDSLPGFTFSEPVFPPGTIWEGDTVYKNDVIVRSTMTAAGDVPPGPVTVTAGVGYQVCIETGSKQCFFPVEKTVSLTTEVLPAGVTGTPLNPAVFGSSPTPESTFSPDEERDLAGSLEEALAKGSLLALFLVFIGGILTSFTPCVYPIIPITISYIGARSEGKKFRGFFLSLFFVLGLALTYSTLGVFAALTGGVFGGLTQHPAVYAVLIVIFLAMGASMMGAFDIQLPASWQGKLQGGNKKGIIGAIFMGAASGLIAAPCVGPVLVALLTWVAKTGSVIVGFGLLFAYASGMGMLFVVIGTFAGAMAALPQAGGWMEGVKHFFGWLLWGTAVYFASMFLPHNYTLILLGAFLSLLGIYIGAFRPSPAASDWNWILRKWFGILAVVSGVFLFLLGFSRVSGWQPPMTAVTEQAQETAPDWIVNDIQGAFQKAKAENKPLMMDFYADWCVACVELDHKTYSQPAVIERSRRFVNLKLDFTSQDETSQRLTDQYQVKGMPTVIFFSPDGRELTRFVGFKSADDVVRIMDDVLARLE